MQGYLLDAKLDAPPAKLIDAISTALSERLHLELAGGLLARRGVGDAAAALGNTARASEVSEHGTGWAVAAAFERSTLPAPLAPPAERRIPTAEFATWWAAEDVAAAAMNGVCRSVFRGSTLIERHGTQLRFQLATPPGTSTGGLFGLVEQHRAALGIAASGDGSGTNTIALLGDLTFLHDVAKIQLK